MSSKDSVEEKDQETVNTADQEPTVEETDTKKEDAQSSLEEEITSLKDQHLRLFAEFENYKKRTSRERLELFETAGQELMTALIPIIDDFKRALENLEGSDAQEGVQLIFNKFENTLKNKGLKAMEDTTGKIFDVDTMEAVTRIPAPDKSMKGKVVDQLETGYYLGKKIIRYAKVVIGE